MSNTTGKYTNERVELIKERLRRFNASKLAIPSSETNEGNKEHEMEERESSNTSENKSANQVNEVKPESREESSPVFAKLATLSSLSKAENRREKTPNSESPRVKMEEYYYYEANKRTSSESPEMNTTNAELRQEFSVKDTIKVNDSNSNKYKNRKNGKEEQEEELSDVTNAEYKTEPASRKNVADSLRAFMRAVAQVESNTPHRIHKNTKKRTVATNNSDKSRQPEREGQQYEHYWQVKPKSSEGNYQNESFSQKTEEQQQEMRERQKESHYYEQQIKNAEYILKQLREMTYQTEHNKQEPEQVHLNKTNSNHETGENNVEVRATEECDENVRVNTDKLFSKFEYVNKGRVELEQNTGQAHERTFDKQKESCKVPKREEQHSNDNTEENTAYIDHNKDYPNTSFSTSHRSSASTSSLSSSNAFTSNGPFSDLTSLNSQSLSTLTSSQSSSELSNSLEEMLPINTKENNNASKTRRRKRKAQPSSFSSSCSSSSESSEPSTSPLSTSLPSSLLPTQEQQNNSEQMQSQINGNPFTHSSSWKEEHQQLNRQGKLENGENTNQQPEKENLKEIEYNKGNVVNTEIKHYVTANEKVNEDEHLEDSAKANFQTQNDFAEHFDLLMEKLAKFTELANTDNTTDNNKNSNKKNDDDDDDCINTKEPAEHFSLEYVTLFNQLEVAEMNIAHTHGSVERFARAMQIKPPARELPRVEQMESLQSHREALLKEETLLRNEGAPDGMTLPEIHQRHCEPFQECLCALSLMYANTLLKLKAILARRDAVEAKRVLWQSRQHDLHERQAASKIIEREIEEIELELQTRRNALRERQTNYELRLHEHSDRDQSIQRHIDGVEELGGTISTWLHILEDRDVQLRRKEEKLARVRADLDRRIEDIQICKNVAKKYRQHSLSSPLSSSESNNRDATKTSTLKM